MDHLLRTLLRKRRGASAWSRPGEFLEFRYHLSAQPLAADPATANAAFVQAVYQDVLGRPADTQALAWGTAQVNSGQPRTDFVEQVVDSDEADADFVAKTYQHYLGRNADEVGQEYWVHEMQAGVNDQEIEAAFLSTAEFYARAGGTQPGWTQAAY